jgi:hypothetical protein
MNFYISAEGCEVISGETGTAVPIPRVGETVAMRKKGPGQLRQLCDTIVESVSYDFFQQTVEIRCARCY